MVRDSDEMVRAEFKALMCAAAPSPFGVALWCPREYAWSTLIAPTAYPRVPKIDRRVPCSHHVPHVRTRRSEQTTKPRAKNAI